MISRASCYDHPDKEELHPLTANEPEYPEGKAGIEVEDNQTGKGKQVPGMCEHLAQLEESRNSKRCAEDDSVYGVAVPKSGHDLREEENHQSDTPGVKQHCSKSGKRHWSCGEEADHSVAFVESRDKCANHRTVLLDLLELLEVLTEERHPRAQTQNQRDTRSTPNTQYLTDGYAKPGACL